MSRKILLIFVTMMLLMVACQPNITESNEASEVNIEQDTQASEENEEDSSTDDVTISFLIAEGPGREAGFSAVIDAFEEQNPTIEVELRTVPFNDFFDQLPVMWASDEPADIVLTDSPDVKSFAYSGTIIPLDDVFADEGLDDFAESIVAELSYNDSLYGGPWEESAIAVYYNVDMFDAAGVQPPNSIEDAWTWEEYVENVNTVIKANQLADAPKIWGMIYLGNPPLKDYWQVPIIRSNGEKGSPTYAAISPDGTSVAGYADTDEAIEAYGFWQSLYCEQGFAPQETIPDAFGTDQAATMISFPAWGSILTGIFPDLNWDVMPLPYMETPITHTGGWSPVISQKSEHQTEAKEFVKFVTSEEGFMIYFEESSVMPARKSLITTLSEFQEGSLKIFADEMVNWGSPRPEGPGHAIYGNLIGQMLADIAFCGDIQEIVPAAIQEIDYQLEQFK